MIKLNLGTLDLALKPRPKATASHLDEESLFILVHLSTKWFHKYQKK